jgi:putative SOS response-associated peptidase YedK
MCGRASDAIDPTGSGPYEFSHIRLPWRKLYNIAPSQEIRIARRVNGAPDHRYVRWGLVPYFAKAEPGALPVWRLPTFNARSEDLEEKPSFQHTLKKQRCLVLINGFYEWTGEKGHKTPHHVFLPDFKPFALAGLWDRWTSRDGSLELVSCTVLTRAAGEFMSKLHSREPIILPEASYDAWLDEKNAKWRSVLDGAGGQPLEEYVVSGFINKRGAEGPECIEPAEGR